MSVDREAAAWSDQQRERLMRSLRRRPAPGPPFPCPYLTDAKRGTRRCWLDLSARASTRASWT